MEEGKFTVLSSGVLNMGSSIGFSCFGSGYTDSGTKMNFNTWGNPERVEVNEVGETIEMVYKQASMLTYTSYPSPPPEVRVFKIVYSCIDGKWNKSEPIFGIIHPAHDEYYTFD